MRRAAAAVLTILLCLLNACGSKENEVLQPPMDFRAALLQAGGCSFTAELTTEVDERVYQFTVRSVYKTDGTAELTVLAPDSIAGIGARLRQNGGELVFDGLALDFGEPADGLVSPLSAPVLCASCWAGEYILASGTEDDTLRVSYESGYDAQALRVETWFEQEKNIPLSAEVCYNDAVVIRMTIQDFQMNGGG